MLHSDSVNTGYMIRGYLVADTTELVPLDLPHESGKKGAKPASNSLLHLFCSEAKC
jgi:hypothetical protein